MQVKLLKEIVSEVAGQSSEKLVDLLYKKKNVNEFLIAKKLNLTINQTRNVLYRLAEVGLVSFVRKKDSKKGGWYTYFWTLNTRKAIDLLKKRIFDKLEKLENQRESRKNERYYYSPEAGLEYGEEEALEHGFICPETGGVLELKDNSEMLMKMEEEITALKNALDQTSLELSELEKKDEQSRMRKARAETKKKEKERRAKRLARQKEKEKLMKKKPSKKKKALSVKSSGKKKTKKSSGKK